MTERKVGDRTVCSQCGAPATYVSLSTFEQYEPSRIQYAPPKEPSEAMVRAADKAYDKEVARFLDEGTYSADDPMRIALRAALALQEGTC